MSLCSNPDCHWCSPSFARKLTGARAEFPIPAALGDRMLEPEAWDFIDTLYDEIDFQNRRFQEQG